MKLEVSLFFNLFNYQLPTTSFFSKKLFAPCSLAVRQASLAFGLIVVGCISTEYNVATHREDIIFYSTEKEVAIGKNIAKKISQKFKISSNPYYIEKVNRIASKIVEVCERQEISYYFYIIDDKEKNAFSIPGGYVYIYKGLIDILNEEELAFVIAHEVAHIVSRHGIKRLQALMGYNLLIIASLKASSDPGFSRGLEIALAQILAGYSREDEFNADELAAKYCRLAGFNPEAGIEVLEKLYQESKKKITPFSYLRTHPFTVQRIRHIKESLRLPLDVDDYINY